MTQEKHRWTSIAVLAVMVAVPLLEIWVIVQLGGALGVGWTVALLLGVAAVGLALVVREGRRTWRATLETIGRGEVPTREISDGTLVMLGGALLIFPGLVSDVLALLCLIPVTRALPRSLIERWAASRGVVSGLHTTQRRSFAGGVVIPGEVVDPEDPTTARAHDNPPPTLEGRIVD